MNVSSARCHPCEEDFGIIDSSKMACLRVEVLGGVAAGSGEVATSERAPA